MDRRNERSDIVGGVRVENEIATNSPEVARRWTSFLASRKEISKAERLLEHFNAGTITRVCSCGCNSYNVAVHEFASRARFRFRRVAQSRRGSLYTFGPRPFGRS